MLIEYELNQNAGLSEVKRMIIDAFRFSDQRGLQASRLPSFDEAD